MSSVLVVNAGSSSLKLALLDPADEVDRLAGPSTTGTASPTTTAPRLPGALHQIGAVGHRVVHGGAGSPRPRSSTRRCSPRIEALTDLAPLHQPRALAGIAAARALLPQVPQVACFDTAFHATCRARRPAYALPAAWTPATACAGTASTGCRTPTRPAAALSSWKRIRNSCAW